MTLENLDAQAPDISAPTRDMQRALLSLSEQLIGLDQLNQRHELCTDPELKLVLAHHRDAARQQIAMLLEWVRRRDARLDKEMKAALFKAGPIAAQYHYE